jgi:hypothetical protein
MGCQKKAEEIKSLDLDGWHAPQYKTLTIASTTGSSEVTPINIFNCRTRSETKAVHYYYSLQVPLNSDSGTAMKTEKGKEITFKNAQFTIDYWETSTVNNEPIVSAHNVFNEKVNFKVIDENDEESTGFVTVSADTVSQISKYVSNPYFNSLKEGDEIMTIKTLGLFKNKNMNLTKMDLPGVKNGDSLECH